MGYYFYLAIAIMGLCFMVYSCVVPDVNMLFFGTICVIVGGYAAKTLRKSED